MNLLPEGVTATAEELVNSVKGHFSIIEMLENEGFSDLDHKQTEEYCASLKREVYRDYMKKFNFTTTPPKRAIEANLPPSPQ